MRVLCRKLKACNELIIFLTVSASEWWSEKQGTWLKQFVGR